VKCINVNISNQICFGGPLVWEKKIYISYQNSPQEYQTDLEVILEFLEEHYRQESRRKAIWNSKKKP